MLCRMPRVSDAHLAGRRAEILAAAARCFAADGFHAASMADVIAASGLSAGAVYRYFRSKEEIIGAVADAALSAADADFSALLAEGGTPSPADAVAVLVRHLDAGGSGAWVEGVDVTRVMVQVWAEALRNPAMQALAGGALQRIRDHLVEVARRRQEAGSMPVAAEPERAAAAMLALVQGFLIQRALVGESASGYLDGVRALLGEADAPMAG